MLLERCPLCESTSIYLLLEREERTYYHCLFCDLIFLDPRFYLPEEEEKRRYQLHNNTPENEGYVKMFRDFLDTTILPFVKERGLALDFGCGPGPVLKLLLEEEGFSVDIYDPYFYPERGEEKKYHLITSTEVVEHIGKAKELWSHLQETLQSGGYLAVMTHFHPGVDRFSDWWYIKDPTHIVFYSHRTIYYIQEALSWRILYLDEKKNLLLQSP